MKPRDLPPDQQIRLLLLRLGELGDDIATVASGLGVHLQLWLQLLADEPETFVKAYSAYITLKRVERALVELTTGDDPYTRQYKANPQGLLAGLRATWRLKAAAPAAGGEGQEG